MDLNEFSTFVTIVTEVENSFNQKFNELRSDREVIKKLEENVSVLTSVVTTTVSAAFIKQKSCQPRMKEIHRRLCLLPVLYNDQLMLMILPRVVLGFLVTNIVNGAAYVTLERNGITFY